MITQYGSRRPLGNGMTGSLHATFMILHVVGPQLSVAVAVTCTGVKILGNWLEICADSRRRLPRGSSRARQSAQIHQRSPNHHGTVTMTSLVVALPAASSHPK